jgi:hypothetical protein
MRSTRNLGDAENHLMKEELLRECIPCDLGEARETGTNRREPAIVLRQVLKDKDALKHRDIKSTWAAAQEFGRLDLVFLTIKFIETSDKPAAQIRICINNVTPRTLQWFKLLIATDGELALNDVLGEVEAISVTGVPLDIPREILARAKIS